MRFWGVINTHRDAINTTFLTVDYDDNSRDNDQCLYLPALRKTKQISGRDKGGSFMGSDFKKEIEVDGYNTYY